MTDVVHVDPLVMRLRDVPSPSLWWDTSLAMAIDQSNRSAKMTAPTALQTNINRLTNALIGFAIQMLPLKSISSRLRWDTFECIGERDEGYLEEHICFKGLKREPSPIHPLARSWKVIKKV